ncbi:MAG: hypothetical protein NHB32_09180 [Fischerella sp. CENA71]|nr:hypothetical protein [Fischerella sp. CENA71]
MGIGEGREGATGVGHGAYKSKVKKFLMREFCRRKAVNQCGGRVSRHKAPGGATSTPVATGLPFSEAVPEG